MSPTAGASGGFSLFPTTNSSKPPSGKGMTRPRAVSPQSIVREEGVSFEMTPPRNGRQTPEDLSHFVIDGTPSSHVDQSQQEPVGLAISQPIALADAPPRTDTAFSGASTLVRNNSTRSRSSIAKRPLEEASASSPIPEASGFRSMFPQYDHTLPFDRQDYFPTQTSPSHIPRQVISRQSHVPHVSESRSPPVRSPVRSPMSAESGTRWPRRPQEPPVVPPVSTTDELRDYWKAANGWKASAADGRNYCMRLEPEKDTPIYYLSSTDQPFYHMRIVPTSASAYITLSRHDPSKQFKERDPNADAKPQGILAALRESEKSKTWHQAITTTLEEESRRFPPEDGLVALLYPCAATKMALEKPGDIQAVMTAERECARLVWDEDSQNYFLVHPALATPFCITVERNPSWSRTEYTLEHIESPQHLAKLTRDGTGEGWMELDTLIAGKIEAHYILDVAVCALLVVANADEKNQRMETFEPPPSFPPPAHMRSDSGRESRSSLTSKLTGAVGGKKEDKKNKKRRNKLEELELDLESQTSSLGKQLDVRDKDKLPGATRTVIKLITFFFKCFIWVLTIAFKALVAVVAALSKCLTSEKL